MTSKIVNLVFGGGGFIGVQLCNALVERGEYTISVDKSDQLKHLFPRGNLFNFLLADMLDDERLLRKIRSLTKGKGVFKAWHLAANSDISKGINSLDVDLNDTFLTTVSLVNLSKKLNIESVVFASSSAVYGDWKGLPLVETDGPLQPISNYGAMKAASEMVLSAAISSTLKKVLIARFPNVVGSPPTHGVIFDFFNKLSANSKNLNVLGNGQQKKQYILSEQLIDILIELEGSLPNDCTFVNIGPEDDGVSVKDIADYLILSYFPNAIAIFENTDRGWVGDVPIFRFDTSLLKRLTGKKVLSSRDAIEISIHQIASFLGKTRL